ncbi:MAG: TetR family transcriptional regulator [Planctomycetes bacterium]|nr:TetR family transcriptional regulator [Planctomycetota bacterium]
MTDSTATPETTKGRILDAAEELFAARGFGATSTRLVTTTADVNLAAVNYHFGSKDGLLRAVFERRLVPLNRVRLERLTALEQSHDEVPLASLLAAFFEPALRLGESASGQRFLRLLGRLHSEPDRSPVRELFFEQFQEVSARFMPLLARALPDVPRQRLIWRVHFMIGAMAHTMMCSDVIEFLSEGACRSNDVEAALRELVSFVEAGLRGTEEEA